MNVDYALIGQRIKTARKERQLTQEKLAEHLGVSIGYVSQFERGITKISLDLLGALADILGKDLAYFVAGGNFASAQYLENEMLAEYEKLLPKNRRLVRQFVELLQKNEHGE